MRRGRVPALAHRARGPSTASVSASPARISATRRSATRSPRWSTPTRATPGSATPRGRTTSRTTAALAVVPAHRRACCMSSCTPRGSRGCEALEGRVRRQHPRRRAVAHELPAHQPASRWSARSRPAAGASCGGARNFVHDMLKNDGWPSQVDRSCVRARARTRGHARAGRLPQRADRGAPVRAARPRRCFEIPLLVCPPWINRYYIADLAPGKSLVEWAVDHGHTVVRDQLPQPRRVDPRPHLRRLPAPRAAHRHRRRAGDQRLRDREHVGDLPRRHDERDVRSRTSTRAATTSCTPRRTSTPRVDYEDAGTLATVFADPATLEALSRRMERHGYLTGKDIARTFDLLRANDLVFRYVVDGWLLGEKPPAFDLLAWNADSTNLPGKAHGEFLRRLHRERARARRVRRDGRAADGLRDRRPTRYIVPRSTTTSSRGACRTAPRSCSRARCASC